MKSYTYESECVDGEIEVEVDEENTYAMIDDGIVYIVPEYRYLRDGKEVQYPVTESVFRRNRSSECTSLKKEKEKFNDFVRQVLSENTIEKPLQEWVMEEFPEQWEEIKKDPIGWFLRKSEQWHIGDDEVKLLTLIAVKSAFYEGLPKIGVLVLGSAGAGKSSAVKSILNMFSLKEGYGAVLWVSNLTKKALSYLAFEDNGKLLKNRCLFIVETIDVEALKELSLLMTEGRLANLTAKSTDDKLGSSYGIVDYPPSVVSTAVNIDYSNDQVTQIMSRFLTVALDLENRGAISDKIYEKIAERGDTPFTYDAETKYIAIAWMYYTPRSVKLPKEIAMKFKEVITEYNQYAFRVYEQGLKVMKIFASLLGKEVVDEEVYSLFSQKLLRYFLVSAVGLTSIELKVLQATSIEFEETKAIALRLKVDTETARAWLHNLARKGLVDMDRDKANRTNGNVTSLARKC
ncbi:ORF A460 [Sulfolobus virus Kamchatka 1]|uniref:ORF A460 n=1 Tax=Sulfolobus virus Kamchatka 1 TaxID=248496 RepID=Q6TDM5_9VIRU|nr:ORF A460 [Sulfolobus virus Kamchatka 1]AAQ94374.1 ORF A460 [Sulfolobus virus Kamchatka 1]